jgi:hypothetical protein
MGDRNGPDAGETTLAAATAAIITARWSPKTTGTGTHGGHPHAPDNGYGANGNGNGYANGGLTDLPEVTPPALSGPTFDELQPVSPAPPVSPAYGHSRGPAAAASYFSAVAPEPVPEVFAPPGAMAGHHDLGHDVGAAREEVRSHVPPGFERRNFGPLPEQPEQPASTGWALPDTRSAVRDEPPSALLGVLPPPVAAHPMPATFAPPEPAPWTDSGWVDFPHDVESQSTRPVATGPGGRVPLPRRTPRLPELDYPLFDHDPAEPALDPVAERMELNRIADFLRVEETAIGAARPDPADLQAVLGAVRAVPDVKDAQLRWNAQAGHTLRIEFADGVDESEVTRSVVRLLRAKLGLAAQPSPEEPTVDSPFRGRTTAGRPRSGGGAHVGTGRPLRRPSTVDVPRLVVENVAVTRLGAEATVEVRLRLPGNGGTVVGEGRGPGVEAYLSRLTATAAGHAVDKALSGWGAPRGKVFVEHVAVVPFGVVEVAVVVLLLSYEGVTEQLSGSAIVGDDPHVTVARATLAALNRRLESLLA